MITAYARVNGRIVATPYMIGEALPEDMLWLDMLNPDENERAVVAAVLNLNLPTRSQMAEIEASSRLRVDDEAIYLTTDILVGAETLNPISNDLTIVVSSTCLLTMRYSEPHAIAIFAHRIQQQPLLFATLADGLMNLLDAIVDRTADVLEMVGRHVDELSRQIFHDSEFVVESTGVKPAKGRKRKEKHLQQILIGIGQAGEINHKIRDSISSMIRLATFLGPLLTHKLSKEQLKKFRALERDLRSLSEHAQFSAHETSFILDATLGQINIEQNAIIKIFSVMAVVFMPPTLFASIWGMNFHNIPELSLTYGYYAALSVMVVSAILPLAYFKHRGWL